jgi:biopolymer transport protein ExbD
MHSGHSSEDEPMAEMNLIPLIDIALTLLIIMMVTTAFVRKPGVSLKLPETVTREGAAEMSKDLIVYIDSKGALFMNGRPVSDAEVQSRLIAAMTDTRNPAVKKDQRLLIKADRAVQYDRVMRVMDMARRAGLTKVTLPTDPFPDQSNTSASALDGAAGRN